MYCFRVRLSGKARQGGVVRHQGDYSARPGFDDRRRVDYMYMGLDMQERALISYASGYGCSEPPVII